VAQEIDTAAALWQNIEALMQHRYKEHNLSRLAEDCGFAQSTASRIKAQKTATGLDKLDMIARAFGLATWQLLVPGFDPNNPPTLQPVSQKERELYEKIMTAARQIAAEPDARKYL
jgi:transcriptional regulator with XRE-family HTH domain